MCVVGFRWALNGAGMTTFAIGHKSLVAETVNDPIHPPHTQVHYGMITHQSAKIREAFEGGKTRGSQKRRGLIRRKGNS